MPISIPPGSRNCLVIGCRRSLLGTVKTPSCHQQRFGHSWISGHPHSILYKPATAVNAAGPSTGHAGSSTGHTGSIASSSHPNPGAGSWFEFAGNGRHQAYTLARFSTLPAVSSTTRSQPAGGLGEAVQDSNRGVAATESSQAGTLTPAQAQSRSAQDAQSPVSSTSTPPTLASDSSATSTSTSFSTTASPTPASPSPSSSTSSTASSTAAAASLSFRASANRSHTDDNDDHWAVNESYSGHGGQSFESPSETPNSTTSSTSPSASSLPTPTSAYEEDPDRNSRVRPSLSSFKDASAINASWTRTSDSLPSPPSSSSPTFSSAPSKAGGLDLSSSTLVQQMLFEERAPHAEESETRHWDSSNKDESKGTDNPAVGEESARVESASTEPSSPSLTTMMLNETSKGSKNKAAAPNDLPVEEDHISKLDIRVGVVRSVKNHPDAESLYIEQVDVGDVEGGEPKEPRTIVSGLVQHVPKEYLEGRAVIVVGNMKPSKLRGVTSQGMLLCAMEQDSEGKVTKVGLLEPAEGSQAGDKVIFEGLTNEDTLPVPVLTPKRKWFEKSRVHFSVQDGIAYYKGSPFKTVQGLVRCKSIAKGQIS